MASKTDTLEKRIQEIEQFAVERVPQDMAYASIQQSLEQLRNELLSGKAIVQIVSQDISQSQALQKLLSQSKSINDLYQIKTTVLPELSGICPKAEFTLVLQNADVPIHYNLTEESQRLGRNPEEAQVLLPDALSLVGGCHAELQHFPEVGWQLRDLNSRNGTYINGKSHKLQQWQTLEIGDQICLGSQSGAAGSAVLVFESLSANTAAVPNEIDGLLNCDAVCLIADLSQPLTDSAQQFLTQASQMNAIQPFIVAAIPSGVAPEVIKTHLSQMQAWINNQSAPLELVPLLLHPTALHLQATVLLPHAQPEFEQLCCSLEALAKGKLEEMLLRRINVQLLNQINALEALLKRQSILLGHKLKQQGSKLVALIQSDLKEQIKRASQKVDEEAGQFFKQVKGEITQSRANLLDELSKQGLPYRIRQFSEALQPIVTTKANLRFVHLRASEEDIDVHVAGTQFCQAETSRWAVQEWKKACAVYNNGGIRGLFQKSYKTLNTIPGFHLPATLFQFPAMPNFQSVLQFSIAEPDGMVEKYKQPSLMSYLLRNLKGQVISGAATILMFTQIAIGLSEMLSKGNGSGNSPTQIKLIITGVLLLVCMVALPIAYHQDKQTKLEDITEKLKKGTVTYYQSLSKNLTERMIQQLSSTLEAEEKRFREVLETIRDQYRYYISEMEEEQQQIKEQMKDYKAQQDSIEKSVILLQRIKPEFALKKERR